MGCLSPESMDDRRAPLEEPFPQCRAAIPRSLRGTHMTDSAHAEEAMQCVRSAALAGPQISTRHRVPVPPARIKTDTELLGCSTRAPCGFITLYKTEETI